MPDDLTGPHAADVLRRAAILQARSETSPGAGLSLDELKRAAEAAGIEGRYVEQAYLGAGEDRAPSAPFLGIETGVQRVRMVPGLVSEQEWGRMVLALRREFGVDGVAESIGGVREWKATQTRVQVEPDGPNTRITVVSEWANDAKGHSLASMLYAGCAATFGGISVVAGDAKIGWLAALIFVMALFSAWFAWGPVRKRARTRGPQLDRAIDALERLAGADERMASLSAPRPTSVGSGGTSAAPRLDPSVLDASPPDAETPRGSARQRVGE